MTPALGRPLTSSGKKNGQTRRVTESTGLPCSAQAVVPQVENEGFTSVAICNLKKATGPVSKETLRRLHVSLAHRPRTQLKKSLAQIEGISTGLPGGSMNSEESARSAKSLRMLRLVPEPAVGAPGTSMAFSRSIFALLKNRYFWKLRTFILTGQWWQWSPPDRAKLRPKV